MILASNIRDLRGESPDKEETERLKALFAKAKAERRPFFLTPQDFDAVLRWKLGWQYRRQEQIRRVNTEPVITAVTRAAFEIESKDSEFELRVRVGILTSLPGVGVPVASAILALVCPDRYGVIDVRAWRQVFPGRASDFSISGYLRYMRKLRALAEKLGWMPQEVDLAIWEFDRRIAKGRRRAASQVRKKI